MEKDEIVNIVFRIILILLIVSVPIAILVLTINLSGDVKTFLLREYDMFFLNAKWGIVSVIALILIVCYFVFDLIKTIKSHRAGKALLEACILNTGRKPLEAFDIHLKYTINTPPCYIVILDENKTLVLNLVDPGGIDKNLKNRYLFYGSNQYLLVADKIYPEKLHLFG